MRNLELVQPALFFWARNVATATIAPQNTLESISTKLINEILCTDRLSIVNIGIRKLMTLAGNYKRLILLS